LFEAFVLLAIVSMSPRRASRIVRRALLITGAGGLLVYAETGLGGFILVCGLSCLVPFSLARVRQSRLEAASCGAVVAAVAVVAWFTESPGWLVWLLVPIAALMTLGFPVGCRRAMSRAI
jgi:hypothetical protein